MKYEMTTPCDTCPFTRGGAKKFQMTKARASMFAKRMLTFAGGHPDGGEFVCHKTAEIEGGNYEAKQDSQHCAGALIFAEKNGNATQMMRICERIGMYRPDRLNMEADVFDTAKEMVSAHSKRK